MFQAYSPRGIGPRPAIWPICRSPVVAVVVVESRFVVVVVVVAAVGAVQAGVSMYVVPSNVNRILVLSINKKTLQVIFGGSKKIV
jgi:hypothetical protein